MEDIAPELLQKLMDTFENLYAQNGKASHVLSKVKKGTATYKDAHDFASAVGEIWADTYKICISKDGLPDGRMYYNIAKRLMEGTLKQDYELVSGIGEQVQKRLNQEAMIGLKPVVPPINQNRIKGIVDRLSEAENFEDISWILDSPVVNFSDSIIDEFVKVNAEMHHKAGLHPKIVRRLNSPCCEWCASLAGAWDYPDDMPDDVFRRHENCDCVVEYDPKDGTRQDIWTKEQRNISKRDEVLDNLAIAQGNVARKKSVLQNYLNSKNK